MKTSLELLREARAWLDDPRHWCSHRFLVFDRDQRVIQACAAGAYYRGVLYAFGRFQCDERITTLNKLLHKIALEMGYQSIPHLNDNGGYAVVLELHDRAIAELEDQQALFDRLEVEMQEFMYA